MTPPSNAACSGPSLLPFNFCVSIVETVVHVFCFLLSKSGHRLGQNGHGNSTLRAGIHSEFLSMGEGGAKTTINC